MNYLSDGNYLNRRAKVWREYAPFYLDYGDALQCGFNVSHVEWLGRRTTLDEKWDGHKLLCVNGSSSGTSLELVNVAYPNHKGVYAPEELVNTDRELSSNKEYQAFACKKPREQIRT